MNPVLLGSLTALCWGTLDLLAGRTSLLIGSARTTAGVTIGGLILLTAWLAANGPFPGLAAPQIWLPLVAGAGFALATMWLFVAISSGPIALAVPLVMSYPATSVVLLAVLGKVPSLVQVALVVLIMAGVLIVAWAEPASDSQQGNPSSRRKRTVGFALIAHVTFLFSVFAGQQAALIFGEIESVWISRLAGTVVVLPFLFMRGGESRVTPRILALLALMGGLDAAALGFLFAAGNTASPELATVCASASGAVTVILAAFFLKEPVALLRWAGIAITFAGIAALSALR